MYSALLIIHSWLRWVAVAGVVIVLVRAIRGIASHAPWTAADTRWIRAAAHTITAQATLGLLLYAVSPYIRGLLANMSAAMADRTSRLFAVEHAAVMLLVVALSHLAAANAPKRPTDFEKHMRALTIFGVVVILMGYAIPWMRPMLRLGA